MTATYALTNALGFEVVTCSRCCGTGNYSFNQVDGSRCYGCGGAGHKFTKRGRAARDMYVASTTVRVEDVQVGDRVIDGRTKFTVASAEIDESGYSILPDGTRQPLKHVMFTSAQGNRFSYSLGMKVRVRRAGDEDLLKAALAYQDTLTASGTPRKRNAA